MAWLAAYAEDVEEAKSNGHSIDREVTHDAHTIVRLGAADPQRALTIYCDMRGTPKIIYTPVSQ